MSILTELNEQANKVCADLLEAKREAKAAALARNVLKAAYHDGRVQELERWMQSLENTISKITEKKETGRKKKSGSD